jgi:uncharacterized membrane protein YjfL (UPF0719 family)
MTPLDPLAHALTLVIYFLMLAAAGALILWLTTLLMKIATKGTDAIEEIARKGNLAVALVYATFFSVIAIVVWRPISPLMASWARMIYAGVGFKDFILFLIKSLIYIGTALALSGAAIFGATRLFTKVTKEVDEWDEIRKGNVAIAVMLCIMALTIGYFVSDFVSYLMVFLGARLAAV